MLPLKHKTTDPADDAKKMSYCMKNERKILKQNSLTSGIIIKNWVVGCISGSIGCLRVVRDQNGSISVVGGRSIYTSS